MKAQIMLKNQNLIQIKSNKFRQQLKYINEYKKNFLNFLNN